MCYINQRKPGEAHCFDKHFLIFYFVLDAFLANVGTVANKRNRTLSSAYLEILFLYYKWVNWGLQRSTNSSTSHGYPMADGLSCDRHQALKEALTASISTHSPPVGKGAITSHPYLPYLLYHNTHGLYGGAAPWSYCCSLFSKTFMDVRPTCPIKLKIAR